MMRVGLAMLQGARHEHEEAILSIAKDLNHDVEVVQLRKGEDVDSTIQGLILPGGESTTMRIASRSEGLLDSIYNWMNNHPNRPVLGTCAGAILLAMPSNDRTPYINVNISRNAWGRQRQSFEADIEVEMERLETSGVSIQRTPDAFGHTPLVVGDVDGQEGEDAFPGVFIRAPRFESDGLECEVIARLGEEIVGVRDGSKCAVTFHPELTNDRRFHAWLLNEIASLSPTD
jgi:5'-phosphate synthase pdxT subunit